MLQTSKIRGIQAGPSNHRLDLSSSGAARAAVPARWDPFISALPFLLPEVPFLPWTMRLLQWWVALDVRVSVLELLSRAVPHLCLLPADQHYLPCLPWALCVSVTSFRSQPVAPALPMFRTLS